MTSDPPATGTFDGSLLDDLVVDVCILSAAGSCDSPPVRQFRSTGSTLYQENIRVDNTRFFYLVYWNTGAGSVDPAKHYRITTRAGSVVLGYADVDVVNNSTELAAVDRTQFAGVVKGNWLPIRFRVNQGALAPVRYLSPPQLSPSGTLVGTPVPVTVRIGIVPSPGAAIQAVRLAQVDAGGQPTGDVAQLFDDGNLASGDDIKGDGVFSGRFSPASNTAQTLRYAVVTQGTFNSQPFSVKSEVAEFKVLSTLPQDDLAKILGAQQKALEALDGSSVTTLGAAMGVLIASLQQDQAVAGVVQVDPNMLEIHFTNGLIGGILLTDGTIKGGGGHAHGPVRAHGPFSGPERPGAGPPRAADAQAVQLSTAPLLGYAGPAAYTFVRADTGRRKTAAIPVEQQTRGVNGAFVAFATPPPPEKAVKSNRMLLYEPSYTEFLPFRDGDDAKALAAKSDVSLQVTHLKDGQASVDALKQLTDYGVILINTHGTGGNVFLSGEVVTLGGWISHAFDILQDRLRVTSHAVVRLDGSGNVVQSEKSVFAVTNKFIAALPGTFPNSIVIADYCQGMKSPQALATAF
ncbi:MAG TPA: hypothetical protein VK399_08950, partial [Longimicrobiaceae bacterium]|nr:hypothetical protein [Longimicrobiaceae bacterium]